MLNLMKISPMIRLGYCLLYIIYLINLESEQITVFLFIKYDEEDITSNLINEFRFISRLIGGADI